MRSSWADAPHQMFDYRTRVTIRLRYCWGEEVHADYGRSRAVDAGTGRPEGCRRAASSCRARTVRREARLCLPCPRGTRSSAWEGRGCVGGGCRGVGQGAGPGVGWGTQVSQGRSQHGTRTTLIPYHGQVRTAAPAAPCGGSASLHPHWKPSLSL